MRFTTLAVGIVLGALPSVAANAATVRFNFNTTTAPQNYFTSEYLTQGQVLTPDIGDATQKATVGIVDPINVSQALQLEDSQGVLLGSGNVLQAVQDSSTVLRLTFARPVYTVNFDFAVLAAAFPPPPIDLNTLVISGYATSSSSTPIATNSSGGNPYVSNGEYLGHLTLSSAFSFSTISFGLSDTTTGDTFALDNIDADDQPAPVPEPGVIALGLSLGLPALWRLGKARKSRLK